MTQNIPSQVWVGNAQILKKAAIKYLKSQFCMSGEACLSCVSCRQVEQGQHHNVIWLAPDGQYKVEQIREVLGRLSLRLAQNEQFYFVFQDAQCLNEASANSLLKSIEEPPLGYNFLFLTSRKELLLTTILSRSLIKQFGSNDGIVDHEIFACFTTKNLNPVEFSAMLEYHKELSDQDSKILLDQIYGYWLNQAKKNQASSDLNKNDIKKINHYITILQQAQDYAPMPGSSKLFWRNLYLQWL